MSNKIHITITGINYSIFSSSDKQYIIELPLYKVYNYDTTPSPLMDLVEGDDILIGSRLFTYVNKTYIGSGYIFNFKVYCNIYEADIIRQELSFD